MTSRLEVVAEARSWIDTPFHHQARAKGQACDCAGLVIGVARALALVPPEFDVTAYPRVPDGKSLLGWCDQYMRRIDRTQMQPGDVVVVAFDKDPQHLGIAGNYWHGDALSMIHAAAIVPNGVGRVIETRLMFTQAMRFVAAYQLPGVA